MNQQRDLFDLEAGLAGKADGMARVAENNPDFMAAHFRYVRSLPSGWRGINEHIREVWEGPWPGHHNAWGKAWEIAIRRGLLEWTPEIVVMRAKKAKGRKTHVYRRV